MAKRQPMTTTVESFPGGFKVHVEHADWQSFSKAVAPALTRGAKAHCVSVARNATRVDVTFAQTPAAGERRWTSTATYQYR